MKNEKKVYNSLHNNIKEIPNNIKNIIEDLENLSKYEHNSKNCQYNPKTEEIKEILDTIEQSKSEIHFQGLLEKILEKLQKESTNKNFNIIKEYKLQGSSQNTIGYIDFTITDKYKKIGIEVKAPIDKDKKYKNLGQLLSSSLSQASKYLSVDIDLLVFTNLVEVIYLTKNNMLWLASYALKKKNNNSISKVENNDIQLEQYGIKAEKFSEFIERLNSATTVENIINKITNTVANLPLDDIFLDLIKKYYDELNNIDDELKLKLINTLVLLRILEDNGLIQYDAVDIAFKYYEEVIKLDKKETVRKFFSEFIKTIHKIYNTELLEWDDNKINSIANDEVYNFVKKALTITNKEEINLINFDFSQIDEDVLGKAYETLLRRIEINKNSNGGSKISENIGVFYTPSYISDFLTRLTVRLAFYDILKEIEKNKNDENKLGESLDKLKKIKFLDPACGSGSFLVKILRYVKEVYDEIRNILKTNNNNRIFSENNNVNNIINKEGFDLLKDIVTTHIYGVDIDAKAVEIAKINIWKEMIILSNVKKPKQKLELPNLENNIKKADSLLEKCFEHNFKVVIGNPPYMNLQEVKQYDDDKKTEILEEIVGEDSTKTIDLYGLFMIKAAKTWLENGGFLAFIVSNKWMRAAYGKPIRKTLKNLGNTLLLMDFKGYKVFKEAQVDTCIILWEKEENKQQNQDLRFIGVEVENNFEEELKTYSNNGKNNTIKNIQNLQNLIPNCEKVYEILNNSKTYSPVAEYIKEYAKELKIEGNLNEENYLLLDDKLLALKKKIEKKGKRLKDWEVKIYRGILTGFNEAFIIDSKKRNEILNNCKNDTERKLTEEIIKPVLRGEDIGRYYYKWKNFWIIIIPAGWTNKSRGDKGAEEYIKETLPTIYNHLCKYKENLEKRDDQGDYWWELRHCDYYQKFEVEEKIVWQRVTQRFSFCLVPPRIYVLDSTAFIISEKYSRFLLGVLNSSLIDWYIRNYVHTLSEGFLLSNQYVKRIPIPPITQENKDIVDQIEEYVSKMLEIEKNNLIIQETENLINYAREIEENFINKNKQIPEEIYNKFITQIEITKHLVSKIEDNSISKKVEEFIKLTESFINQKQQLKDELIQSFEDFILLTQGIKQHINNINNYNNNSIDYTKEIDNCVYELYGLDQEEIKLIENIIK